MSNDTVKIGCTGNFKRRSRQSGMEIVNWYHIEYLPSSQAYKIESECHRVFQEDRINGEFFNIDFAEAYMELERRSEIIESMYI